MQSVMTNPQFGAHQVKPRAPSSILGIQEDFYGPLGSLIDPLRFVGIPKSPRLKRDARDPSRFFGSKRNPYREETRRGEKRREEKRRYQKRREEERKDEKR